MRLHPTLGEPVYASASGADPGVWAGTTRLYGGRATSACWLDAETVIAQIQIRPGDDGSWLLATRKLSESDWQPVVLNEQGELVGPVIRVRAGGGVWAADTANHGPMDSRGPLPAGSEVIDVSPEGRVLICTDRETGQGLAVFDKTGAKIFDRATAPLIPDGVEGSKNARLRGSRLVWADTDGEHEWDVDDRTERTIIARDDRPGFIVPVGERLLLEMSTKRLTLRDRLTTFGIVLSNWRIPGRINEDTSKYTNSPDSVRIEDWVYVTFSRTQGTVPSSVETHMIDPAQPAVDLNQTPEPAPTPEPPAPPPGPPDDPPKPPPSQPPVNLDDVLKRLAALEAQQDMLVDDLSALKLDAEDLRKNPPDYEADLTLPSSWPVIGRWVGGKTVRVILHPRPRS